MRAGRAVVESVVGAVVLLYLLAGAAWSLAPFVLVTCPPLSLDTKIVQHHGGAVQAVVDWVTWPADLMDVQRQAARRGVPLMDVVRRRACRLEGDAPG